MKYRKATAADLEQISKLFDQYRIFYRKESDLDQATQFLQERIQQNDSQIFVAEQEESTLIGFVQLYPLFSSTKMKKMWLLNDLFVAAKHRGKGISKGLIEKAKEHAINTKACGLTLETEKTNLIGNRLYPQIGFKLNEQCHFYEWSC